MFDELVIAGNSLSEASSPTYLEFFFACSLNILEECGMDMVNAKPSAFSMEQKHNLNHDVGPVCIEHIVLHEKTREEKIH